MKRATLTLVLATSFVYYAILFVARGFFAADFNPPPYFLAVPLLILVVIFLRDLSRRATVPAESRLRNPPSHRLSQEVQQLTLQIHVGMNSSPAYFERAVVGRLQKALVERVALETGIDMGIVMKTLASAQLGPALLKNERLYRLLYSPPPGRGSARARMLEETIALVESWKP